MILIKLIEQDIKTCLQCKFSNFKYSCPTHMKRILYCEELNKKGFITTIRKDCPLLSRHDLLKKAKELYHKEKLENES